MMVGKARGFVSLVLSRFRELGYKPQLFLLNSATMGVPQKRERLFFIASREDQDFPLLQLEFNEPPILYGDIRSGDGSPINPDSKTYTRWHKRRPPDLNMGDVTEREEGKMSNFNTILLKDQKVANTYFFLVLILKCKVEITTINKITPTTLINIGSLFESDLIKIFILIPRAANQHKYTNNLLVFFIHLPLARVITLII